MDEDECMTRDEGESFVVGGRGFSGEEEMEGSLGFQVEGGGLGSEDGRLRAKDASGFSSEDNGTGVVGGGVEEDGNFRELDTEELVEEAMKRIPAGLDVPFELRPCEKRSGRDEKRVLMQ